MYDSIKYIHGGKFVSSGSWTHPDRTIDSCEIILIIKGCAYINSNGVEYTLNVGDCLRIEPGIRHFGYRESVDPLSFYWIHYTKADAYDKLPPIFFKASEAYRAELLCRQIIHCERTDGYSCDVCSKLLGVLLSELELQSRDAKSVNTDHLFDEISEWIRKNSDRLLKVSDVASKFSYNEDYICRLFKKGYPEGIKAYIDRCKMDKIKRELISGYSTLKRTALDNSFSDYKYFLKYFKYHEGITPSEFIKAYGKQNINNK